MLPLWNSLGNLQMPFLRRHCSKTRGDTRGCQRSACSSSPSSPSSPSNTTSFASVAIPPPCGDHWRMRPNDYHWDQPTYLRQHLAAWTPPDPLEQASQQAFPNLRPRPENLQERVEQAQRQIDAYIAARQNNQALLDNFYLRQRQILWDIRAQRLLGGPPLTSISLPEATRWLQSLVQLAADIPRLDPWTDNRTVSEEVEAFKESSNKS
jgi:hypothetical protein